ncbi:uncharacterized protein FTOL_03046 [Fusarium torulosum]|uniref:Uncharacterized protein n=1 Tax=Fusarium torulosum TaxID=33205 RepID=A0AAE8M2V7_9HYPO|nr:uncharacterized protein FTOL_03046 [Fusarium torulosum]
MDEMNERMKELEAEMSNLRINMWAHEVAPGKPQPASRPSSLSSYTLMEAPVSSHGNTVIALSDRSVEEDQHDSATTKDDDAESTATVGCTIQLENSEVAQSSVSLTSSNENFCDTKTNLLSTSDDKTEVQESLGNSLVNDPTSPLNTTNPHPTLSIATEFLHKAIIDCRKPGGHFERSILHRERIDTPEVTAPDSVLNGVYTDWTWIPFLVSGAAAELVPTNICEGDIELICIKNKTFVAMIENNKNMFEYPSILLEPSYLVDKFAPDFSEPEACGLRVLAWRIHGPEECCYMDRAGHPVLGPLGLLPWQMIQIKD